MEFVSTALSFQEGNGEGDCLDSVGKNKDISMSDGKYCGN